MDTSESSTSGHGSSTSADVPDGLRILCFDGGGVRGKASLLLLKEIMDYVEQGAKPCEFFDLIAGTSTGGLIALMLARLRYSVADAIKKYDELGPRIFCNVAHEGVWARNGTPLVDEGPAERAFREIGREGDADGDVDNGQYDGCKCLVATVLQDYPTTFIPIRSYHCDDRADPITSENKKWKIWEAARAATAAPVYFRPLEKDGRKFIDAGAGYNNPSVEVFNEIKGKIHQFKDRPIACFVSIGTGVSPTRPAPSQAERSFSLGFPLNVGEMNRRATALVQYLASVASNTATAHKEMRSRMQNGLYFRINPGINVGSINLADVARLQGMEDLVRDNIQHDDEIEAKLRDCARTLKAASPRALQALLTPNRITTEPAPVTPTLSLQGEWFSIPELLEIPLGKPAAVPAFLMIFSFSVNFDLVLETLRVQYNRNDTPETTQGCILFLLNKFVRNLWLTDHQISKLDEYFNQNSNEQVQEGWLAHQRNDLADIIQDTKKLKETTAIPNYSLASLIHHTNFKELSQELAEALAILEDNLRRTDPVGECVRWMARSWARDFMSFPERVKYWVLYSILHAEPADMRKCYYLFYKVAKRSRDNRNFSAVQAIMSALKMLEPLRKAISLEPQEFHEMMSLDFTWLAHAAKDKDQAYLFSLDDGLVDKPSVAIAKLADSQQQIHWDWCKELFVELKEITSRPTPSLTSPSKYVFGRDRVVAFVKQSLIEVEVINLSESKILDDAIGRYKENTSHPIPPLWRE